MSKRGQFKPGSKPGSKPKWFWLGDDAHQRWPARLQMLLVRASTGHWRHNGGDHGSQKQRDLRRAIRMGLIVVTQRECRTVKRIVLTEKGRALIATSIITKAEPYAKRRQAIAEFKEANRHD